MVKMFVILCIVLGKFNSGLCTLSINPAKQFLYSLIGFNWTTGSVFKTSTEDKYWNEALQTDF